MIEVVVLAVAQHSTVPFVQLIALSALAVGGLPWYGYGYMLAGISLNAFLQGFCITTNVLLFGCLAVASLVCEGVMVKSKIVQTLIVLGAAAFVIAINCIACLTLIKSCIAVLFVVCMVRLLQ